ncbi:PLP-dependent aminotransferase family protein, partial [Klebsiella pneumoniae]|nr:PLP-dependent aminotransferase family protein [Klebsiella pneumoniae]
PGDWVVVENPCFYGALQALERLRLKALSVATDVREGIDLTALVALLTRYNVMLIEDDVYSELYFGREKPLPAKFWDRQEMTL